MMKKQLVLSLVCGTLVLGCGEGEPTAPQSTPATEPEPASAGKTPEGTMIDHTQDEKEFMLKRSLAGVEDLITDLKAKGQDVSELEVRKEKLETELKALN